MKDTKALEAAETIVRYCEEQKGCQNCIFRKHKPDHWDCNVCAFDLRDALANKEAKKRNGGYI